MWNGILLEFLLIPRGLEEPVEWRKYKCKIIIIKIMKGRMKCKEKNRFNVALLIENPPQIHITIDWPM
jgi:hypothetical protein